MAASLHFIYWPTTIFLESLETNQISAVTLPIRIYDFIKCQWALGFGCMLCQLENFISFGSTAHSRKLQSPNFWCDSMPNHKFQICIGKSENKTPFIVGPTFFFSKHLRVFGLKITSLSSLCAQWWLNGRDPRIVMDNYRLIIMKQTFRQEPRRARFWVRTIVPNTPSTQVPTSDATGNSIGRFSSRTIDYLVSGNIVGYKAWRWEIDFSIVIINIKN